MRWLQTSSQSVGEEKIGECANGGQKLGTVFLREKEQLCATKPDKPPSESSFPDGWHFSAEG